MKKAVSVMLALTLLLCGCAGGGGASRKSLKEHGLDVIAQMDEMVHSDAYISAYVAGTHLQDSLAEFAKGSRENVSKVLKVTAGEGLPEAYMELTAGTAALSDGLKAVMLQKYMGAVPTQLNSRNGAETLAATAVCTAGKAFVNDELTETAIYIYLFEDPETCPVAVVFAPGEDGAVSASGTFLAAASLEGEADTTEEALLNIMQSMLLNVEELAD